MKQRKFVASAIGAVATLAIGASAFAAPAVTLNQLMNLSGGVEFDFSFADSGTVYKTPGSDGVFCSSPTDCDAASLIQTAAPGAYTIGTNGEDTWGIINIKTITVKLADNSEFAWKSGVAASGNNFLRGMVYGGVDQSVSYNSSTGEFTALGAGAKLDLYLFSTDMPNDGPLTAATPYGPVLGSPGRTALDQYTDFTNGTGFAGLIASLTFDTFTSKFSPLAPGFTSVQGGFGGYASATGATQMDAWLNTDTFNFFTSDGDFSGTGTCSTSTPCDPWTETGQGVLKGYVIPEPGSLALVGLGLIGLGRIRSRRTIKS